MVTVVADDQKPREMTVLPRQSIPMWAAALKSGARWATVFMVKTVAADQEAQPMVILPRRSIPTWAVTLDASRCAPRELARFAGGP
jgi:hypothetical protein